MNFKKGDIFISEIKGKMIFRDIEPDNIIWVEFPPARGMFACSFAYIENKIKEGQYVRSN